MSGPLGDAVGELLWMTREQAGRAPSCPGGVFHLALDGDVPAQTASRRPQAPILP